MNKSDVKIGMKIKVKMDVEYNGFYGGGDEGVVTKLECEYDDVSLDDSQFMVQFNQYNTWWVEAEEIDEIIKEEVKATNNRKFEKVSLSEWMKNIVGWMDEEQWKDCYYKIILPARKTKYSSCYDFHMPFDIMTSSGMEETIPTGIKASMNDNNVLNLYPRSSLGFKYGMKLSNTTGIVDADYFDNPKNEGHIFVRYVNPSDKVLTIKQGEGFCQGMFVEYLTTVDDMAEGERQGGIGSTNSEVK